MKRCKLAGILWVALQILMSSGGQAQATLRAIVKMSDGSIQEVDMATSAVSQWGANAATRAAGDSAGAAVIGPNGNLFISDRIDNNLVEYTPAGAVVGTVDTSFGFNYDLIAAPDGFAYVSDSGGGAYDNYIQVDYASGKTGTIRSPASDTGYGGGVRESTIANDGLFWITMPSANTIKVYDFVATNEVANYDGFMPGSSGSALDRITTRRSDGHVFALQENSDQLLELDPTHPAGASVILQQYDLSGYTFRDSPTIQFGPDGILYMIDTTFGAGRTSDLRGFSLNPSTGAATEVFNVNLGAGVLAFHEVAFIDEAPTVAFSRVNLADTVGLEFLSESLVGYTLQLTTDLVTSSGWATASSVIGTGTNMFFFDPTEPAGSSTNKAYRILID